MSYQVEIILLIANTVYNIVYKMIHNITNSIVICVSSFLQEIWKKDYSSSNIITNRNLYDP